MKYKNKISIIIPFHNQDVKMLDNFFDAKFEIGDNIQIIIVANNNTISKKFSDSKYESNFELVECEDNHKKNMKIAKGVKYATGDFVAIFDPDDEIHILNLKEILKKDLSEVELIISNYEIWLESKDRIVRKSSKSYVSSSKSSSFVKVDESFELLHENPMHNASPIYNTDLLKEAIDLIRKYDEIEMQDLYVFLSYIEANDNLNIYYNDKGHYIYKKYDITNTNTYSMKRDYYSIEFISNYIKAFDLIKPFKESAYKNMALMFIVHDVTKASNIIYKKFKLSVSLYVWRSISDLLNMLGYGNFHLGRIKESDYKLRLTPKYCHKMFWKVESNIALGTTFYKESSSEIVSYYERLETISDKVELLAAIDSDCKQQFRREILDKVPFVKFYFKSKNKGKFDSIYNLSKLSGSKYIKICDPDDVVTNDFDLYNELNRELESVENNIVIHKFTYVGKDKVERGFSSYKSTGLYEKDFVEKDNFKMLPFNANYIFKPKVLSENFKNINNFTAHSDLYIIALMAKKEESVYYLDFDLYKYYYGIGISTRKWTYKYARDKNRVLNYYKKNLQDYPEIYKQSLLHYNYYWSLFNNWSLLKINKRSMEEVDVKFNNKLEKLNINLDEWGKKRPDFH